MPVSADSSAEIFPVLSEHGCQQNGTRPVSVPYAAGKITRHLCEKCIPMAGPIAGAVYSMRKPVHGSSGKLPCTGLTQPHIVLVQSSAYW